MQGQEDFKPWETGQAYAKAIVNVFLHIVYAGAWMGECVLRKDVGKEQFKPIRLAVAGLICMFCAMAVCPLGMQWQALGQRYLQRDGYSYVVKTVTVETAPEFVWSYFAVVVAATIVHSSLHQKRRRGKAPFVSPRYSGFPLLWRLAPEWDEMKIKRYVEPPVFFFAAILMIGLHEGLALLFFVISTCMWIKAERDREMELDRIEELGTAMGEQQYLAWQKGQLNHPGGPQQPPTVRQIPKRR